MEETSKANRLDTVKTCEGGKTSRMMLQTYQDMQKTEDMQKTMMK